jgi:putative ABC transport system permease protein
VVCELAFALILLAGAGLMIRSVLHLLRLDLGFNASNVLTMRLDRALSKGYKEGYKVEAQRRTALFHQLIEGIKGLPGVQSVGATSTLPLHPTAFLRITADKQSNAPRELEVWTDPYRVVPDYFAAMGIPILRGRAFNYADGVRLPGVVIIDATMARRFWPGEDAMGKRLKKGFHDGPNEWLTVVGIVPHVQNNQPGVQDLGEFTHTEQVYFPATDDLVSMWFAIRTRVDPLSLAEAVRREVWKLDRNQPISEVATMESLVSAFTAEPRFYMYLLSTFAALALILGAMGIYGVTSYWVAQRTHEIGVRMALGAQSKDVLRMVLRQSVGMTAVGLALGIGGALALTRYLTGMIYGLSAYDPAAFASVSALLAIVAVAASFIPARRATKVDPMIALRYE